VENFSIREIIEQAVQTERLGNGFYSNMAQRFKENDKLKNLFELLATKERQHEIKFSELKNKVKDEEPEGWEEASQYLRAIVESEFFLGKHKSLPSLEHLRKTEDAVRYALGFEKETLLYYHGLREIVRERKIMDEIINEEKSHIVWLNEYKNKLQIKNQNET
jgi:rubrerythrin